MTIRHDTGGLTYYDNAVKEAARLTNARLELDENEKARISNQLSRLQAQLAESPTTTNKHPLRHGKSVVRYMSICALS